MIMKKCPSCGYFTVEGDFDICEVCYWQYDAVAHEMPDRVIGANKVSLHQAQKNYKEFGATEKRFLKYVRAPEADELPENNVED